MPSCAQRLTVFGDTWRRSATWAVRRYLGSVGWGNALSRSCCRPPGLGSTLCLSGPDAIERSTQAGHLAMLWCGLAPGRWRMHGQQSAVAGPWSFARRLPQWLPLKQLACTAIVLLLDLPGRPAVTANGRSRYCAPGRGSRSASQPAGRACPLAAGASVGPASVDTMRRWREGQVHDGWNREMVQRREGLRLYRP
jgi:hypothetical protein